MVRQLILASLTAFFVLPVCIFVHELGHYLVAISHGWTTKLMPAQVTYQLSGQTDLQRILFLIGGPIVDVLQFGSGFSILYFYRDSESKSNQLLYWTGISLAFVSVKWLLTPIFAAVVPLNDEVQISALLGWPPMLLPCLVMLLSIPMLCFLVKQHISHSSWIPLLCIPVFGFLGAVTWVMLIGPILLNAS